MYLRKRSRSRSGPEGCGLWSPGGGAGSEAGPGAGGRREV